MSLFIMGVLMFSFMAVGVLAQESDSNVQTSNAVSISDLAISSNDVTALATSDEDVDSSSGIFADQMKSWFTFNKERKAEIKMRIAKKRMFEVGEKARNNPDKAKEIAEEYKQNLDEALDNFDQIAVDGDKAEVIHALKRTVIVKFKLENHKEKSSEIHERILENKADQMSEEQLNHLEDVFSAIQEHIDSSIERVEQTQDNLKARLIALGVDESVIDEKISSFEGVLEERMQQRQERMQNISEKMKEYQGQIMNQWAGQYGGSSNLSNSNENDNSNENGNSNAGSSNSPIDLN